METVSFNIPSISCSACSNKIKEGIWALEGITDISIDLKTQTVKVEYNPEDILSQDIMEKISSMGYEVIQ